MQVLLVLHLGTFVQPRGDVVWSLCSKCPPIVDVWGTIKHNHLTDSQSSVGLQENLMEFKQFYNRCIFFSIMFMTVRFFFSQGQILKNKNFLRIFMCCHPYTSTYLNTCILLQIMVEVYVHVIVNKCFCFDEINIVSNVNSLQMKGLLLQQKMMQGKIWVCVIITHLILMTSQHSGTVLSC